MEETYLSLDGCGYLNFPHRQSNHQGLSLDRRLWASASGSNTAAEGKITVVTGNRTSNNYTYFAASYYFYPPTYVWMSVLVGFDYFIIKLLWAVGTVHAFSKNTFFNNLHSATWIVYWPFVYSAHIFNFSFCASSNMWRQWMTKNRIQKGRSLIIVEYYLLQRSSSMPGKDYYFSQSISPSA
jgi:hypothetical protein